MFPSTLTAITCKESSSRVGIAQLHTEVSRAHLHALHAVGVVAQHVELQVLVPVPEDDEELVGR